MIVDVEVMTRDEFIEAHRAECRRFFEILQFISRTWYGPRSEGKHNHRDLVAESAARIQREKDGPTIQDRINARTLIVTGFDR